MLVAEEAIPKQGGNKSSHSDFSSDIRPSLFLSRGLEKGWLIMCLNVESLHMSLKWMVPCCRFDLGDAAPQANGIKVYPMGKGQEEIMIEVDFSWVGNQDVQLTMKPIPKHLGPFSPAGALLSSIIRLRVSLIWPLQDFYLLWNRWVSRAWHLNCQAHSGGKIFSRRTAAMPKIARICIFKIDTLISVFRALWFVIEGKIKPTYSDGLSIVSSFVQAGIERIIVNGRIRFQFRPLLGELPIIGGMQVENASIGRLFQSKSFL